MSIPTFDTLLALLDQDPVAFERLREKLIEEEIRDTPPETQRRLRGLQFQIEGIRQTSKNPLDCCVKIQRAMDKKLEEFRKIVRDNHRSGEQLPKPDNNVIFMQKKDEPQ